MVTIAISYNKVYIANEDITIMITIKNYNNVYIANDDITIMITITIIIMYI